MRARGRENEKLKVRTKERLGGGVVVGDVEG
jgi:hypothetical protein